MFTIDSFGNRGGLLSKQLEVAFVEDEPDDGNVEMDKVVSEVGVSRKRPVEDDVAIVTKIRVTSNAR